MSEVQEEIVLPECCGGWGEVIEEGIIVACPICYPEAYEAGPL